MQKTSYVKEVVLWEGCFAKYFVSLHFKWNYLIYIIDNCSLQIILTPFSIKEIYSKTHFLKGNMNYNLRRWIWTFSGQQINFMITLDFL